MTKIKNAIIVDASIDTGDRGLLTAWIFLDYSTGSQGFGGHALYLPKSFTHHGGPNYAGHFIFRVMEIAGVEKWSDLKGKTIRAKGDSFTSLDEIGHIIKDEWFNPRTEFKQLEHEYKQEPKQKAK